MLREALRDPQLRLLLYLPASDGFADLRGRPAELDPSLAAVRVERDGVPEAVVQYLDTGDPVRQSRVRQLVEHGRLALQVARLSVELNRQLDELDRSRARIAEAADEERRRIQRDLHDGAQQRLVTVGIGLRGDRKQAADRRCTRGCRSRRWAGRGPGRHHRGAAQADPSAAPAAARLGDRRGIPGACRTRAYPGHRGRRS